MSQIIKLFVFKSKQNHMSFKTCSYFHIIFINLFKKINYNNKYLLIFNKN
jgi:hypothetical protein